MTADAFRDQVVIITGDASGIGRALALSNNVEFDDPDGPSGEPTELALFDFACRCGYDKQALLSDFPRLREVPFHSETKHMITVHYGPDGLIEHPVAGGFGAGPVGPRFRRRRVRTAPAPPGGGGRTGSPGPCRSRARAVG